MTGGRNGQSSCRSVPDLMSQQVHTKFGLCNPQRSHISHSISRYTCSSGPVRVQNSTQLTRWGRTSEKLCRNTEAMLWRRVGQNSTVRPEWVWHNKCSSHKIFNHRVGLVSPPCFSIWALLHKSLHSNISRSVVHLKLYLDQMRTRWF